MKTLKQWFDSLSPEAQQWVENNCIWFDKNQIDYYKKGIFEITDEEVKRQALDHRGYSSSHAKRLVFALEYLRRNNLVSTEEVDDCLVDLCNDGYLTGSAWLSIRDEEKRRRLFIATNKTWSGGLDLARGLYLVKDFDNMKLSVARGENNVSSDNIYVIIPEFSTTIIEIIGKDLAKSYLEYRPLELHQTVGKAIDKYIRYDSNKTNEVFDEMFFCKNDTIKEEHRKYFLVRAYGAKSLGYNATTTIPTLDGVSDFLTRIVAVDHSYLRYLYNIISGYPALAMKLYSEKKPDTELTGMESTADTFRYSPELRKLFAIIHACILKNVSKSKSSMCKEVAPLLKLYGYNWDNIYDALYPEDSVQQ